MQKENESIRQLFKECIFFSNQTLDSTEEYYQIISEAKVVVVQSNGTPMPSED